MVDQTTLLLTASFSKLPAINVIKLGTSLVGKSASTMHRSKRKLTNTVYSKDFTPQIEDDEESPNLQWAERAEKQHQ